MNLLIRLIELRKLVINRLPQKIEYLIPKLVNPEIRNSTEEQESHPE